MDDFEQKLNSIDIPELKDYLEKLDGPCYESQLLRRAFKDMDIIDEDPLVLFQNHFVLFHLLYKFQEEYYTQNKYLHVHFMRTFLTDYPDEGNCRFYDEHRGAFCGQKCTDRKNYCSFHLAKIGSSNIEFQSSKYFYLDRNNYYKFNRETASELLNGAWEVISDYDNYKKSFEVLGLAESSSLDLIKKRYKYLAKKYHPDHGGENEKAFTEINNAYRYLMKMLSLKKNQ